MRTSLQGASNGAFIHQLERLFQHGTAVGLTEGELLDRFVRGRDEAAFEALIARHGPMVLGICRRLLRDPNDVDDAFQATFLVLVRKAGSLRRCDLLGNWLYGVAHRVAKRSQILAARRLARMPHGPGVVDQLDAHDGRPNGDEPSMRDPDPAPWLHDEVRRLPEKYRTLVLLCYFEGLTYEEAAARLGCPIGTVKGRLARARELLRKRLLRRGVGVSAAALDWHLALPDLRFAVPEPLKNATLKAALSIAGTSGGSIVTASSVSLSVATLTDGVLRAMILTPAKAITIPLLIAGIVTTGAVIGATQYALPGGPPAAGPQAEPPRKVTSQDQPDPQGQPGGSSASKEAGPKSASELLAGELKADQEMFDYLASDNRDVRHDDTQMLIRLSQRMLAAGLDLRKDHASRLEAYQAHRERLGKLFQWTRHESGTRTPDANKSETNLVSARLKEADDLIEQEKKSEPAASSADAKTKAAGTKDSATKKADSAADGPGQAGAGGMMAMMGGGMGGAWGPGYDDATAEFQKRLTIAHLAGALAVSDKNPSNEVLLRKLDQPLTMSFARPTPLDDVLQYIRSSLAGRDGATIPIYVDPKGLEEAKATLTDRVIIDLRGVPLKTALRLILKQMGLAYCVRDGVLIISSVEGVRQELAEAARELLGSGNEQVSAPLMRQMGILGGSMGFGMGGGMR